MKIFGLIGNALSHSLSQQFFKEKFLQNGIIDAEYQLFPLAKIEELKVLLKHPTLFGFNVTIPYKSEIIPFLDELDIVAQEIGAVNCVVKQNNKWIGYNTDVIGFEKTLEEIPRYALNDKEAFLVLGSGGASKAVCYTLKQKNIPFQIVSRKKTKETITYHEITNKLLQQSSHIINTTPLGMFPHIDEMPQIPYTAICSNHILIDLIYNPEETLFLKEGKKRGAFTINGMHMFIAQAEESYLRFKDLKI
jgi:shikimate dehydrogenase